jgi:nitrate/nitrite transport system ATP-binding protein
MSGAQPFLEARGLAVTFRTGSVTRDVLRHVDLTVMRGEFVGIVGPMGCGKSTLLNVLAGLVTPDEGTVTIDGEPVRGVRPDAAIVFQNYSLLPWFSALENVRLAIQAAFPTRSKSDQRDQAKRHLEQVGLGNAVDKRPGQLSGGMRQRVAIARAFATEPRVLFLDEPFGALDALTRGSLQQDLAAMCAEAGREITTVMITNNVEEAILLSDRIVAMTRGPRATLGTPIPVALPRPRTVSALVHDDEAAKIRASVIARLTQVAGRTGLAGQRIAEAS